MRNGRESSIRRKLLEITAQAAGLAAHVDGGRQLDVGSLDLDEEVNGSDVQHDTSIGKRVDDGLDALVARFAYLDETALLDAVERGLLSVNDGVAGWVQFKCVLAVNDGNDLLSLTALAGNDGNVGFLVAVGHQDVSAFVDGVVVVGAVESVDAVVADVALGLGHSGRGDIEGVDDKVGPGFQRIENFSVGVGQGRETLPIAEAPTDVRGDHSFMRTDESHLAVPSDGVTLDGPAGTQRRIVLSVNVLDDESEQVAVPHVDQRPDVSPIEVLRIKN